MGACFSTQKLCLCLYCTPSVLHPRHCMGWKHFSVSDSALSPSNLPCNVQQPWGGRRVARMKESRPVSVEPEPTGQRRAGRYRVTLRCTCRCATSGVSLSVIAASVRPGCSRALRGAISSMVETDGLFECTQNTRSQPAESPLWTD